MRLHISLRDELVSEMDGRVGPRGRSAFIAAAVARALEDERRWDLIESAIASVVEDGHAWDDDSAAWVHDERRETTRLVG
jgi:metal-responsive CopG/Arc/MetJ family transcriptional regulator